MQLFIIIILIVIIIIIIISSSSSSSSSNIILFVCSSVCFLSFLVSKKTRKPGPIPRSKCEAFSFQPVLFLSLREFLEFL